MKLAALQATASSTVLPAPSGGMNTEVPLPSMPPENCVLAVNFIPRQYGTEVRPGFQIGNESVAYAGASTEVRTIIPYVSGDGVSDILFVVTQEGIFKSTAPGTAVHTWATKTGLAGYCSWEAYTTIAGKFILVADEVNGLRLYTAATDTWSVIADGVGAGQIDSGGAISTADIVFVANWKNRLWFVPRNSAEAWYLPVGQITGAVTRFTFGNKFELGGSLKGVYNYNLDSGNGPDDYLIAVSSGGDVLAYQGTDPDTPELFTMIGAWKTGSPPAGRRSGAVAGADLYLLTTSGVISITELLRGAASEANPSFITGKINNLVREHIGQTASLTGWSIFFIPSEGLLMITAPRQGSSLDGYTQYTMNIDTRAWAIWQGLPIIDGGALGGRYFFGGASAAGAAIQCNLEGFSDGATTTDLGASIFSYMITRFLGPDDGTNMQVGLITPMFLAGGKPNYQVEARYDFDSNRNVSFIGSVPPTIYQSLWGSSTWGDALWGEDGFQTPERRVLGLMGMGKFAAVLLKMKSISKVTLIGFLVHLRKGGFL